MSEDNPASDPAVPSRGTRLEAKIDGMSDRIDGLRELIGHSLADHAVTKTRVGAVEVDVSRLHQEVFIGNGHPSVLTRMTNLEGQRHQDRNTMTSLSFRQEEARAERELIRRDVSEIRHGGSEAHRALEARLDAYIRDQIDQARGDAEGRRNLWLALGGILATLVAAVITVFATR